MSRRFTHLFGLIETGIQLRQTPVIRANPAKLKSELRNKKKPCFKTSFKKFLRKENVVGLLYRCITDLAL